MHTTDRAQHCRIYKSLLYLQSWPAASTLCWPKAHLGNGRGRDPWGQLRRRPRGICRPRLLCSFPLHRHGLLSHGAVLGVLCTGYALRCLMLRRLLCVRLRVFMPESKQCGYEADPMEEPTRNVGAGMWHT